MPPKNAYYCCNCAFGPMLLELYAACIECGAPACRGCRFISFGDTEDTPVLKRSHKTATKDAYADYVPATSEESMLLTTTRRTAGGQNMREPLDQRSQSMNWSERNSYSNPIAGASLGTEISGVQDQLQKMHLKDCVLFDDAWSEENPSKAGAAKSWITKLERKWELLEDLSSGNRVKIAILDTGVDLYHPNIQANEERIINTWTSDHGEELRAKSRIRDDHGHGTHIVDLLLRAAPQADIFVAQVVKGDIEPAKLEETGQQIAKALRHAVQKWKVDIVSLSIGFDEIITPLENEILRVKDQCLIFAAASNYGGNKNIAFPARVEGIICIHSAQSNGTPSDFTPDPVPGNNFSTLGEQIESAWVVSSEVAVKSGTSFATPIAVAFAAFVLEFGRRNISNDALVQRMKRAEYMKKIVIFLCGGKKRGGYYYLNPTEFFRSRNSGWTKKEERDFMRLHIESILGQ